MPDGFEEVEDLLVFLGVDGCAVDVGCVLTAGELFFPEIVAFAAEGRMAYMG